MTVCAVLAIAACGRGHSTRQSGGPPGRGLHLHDDSSARHGSAPSVASCDTASMTICYQDTARAGTSDEDPAQYPLADWIWFAVARDSIEISAPAGSAVTTNIGQERDALHNTRGYFRYRALRDGVLLISVSLDETQGATVPYTLQISRGGSPTSGFLRPTGATATLTVISGDKAAAFSLVPGSIASAVRDRSPWRIYAGRFKVALVSDSLYELCRLPCSSPDTVELTPSANVVKKF